MSRREAAEFNQEQGATTRALRGMLRRVAIKLTRRAAEWQVLGHRIRGERETTDAEPFTGIGYYARPRTTSNAEAVLAQIGEARHVVIIAMRDEDLRKLVDGQVPADGSAMFNSASVVLVANDLVEARSIGGTASPLATLADLEALRTWVSTHTHSGVTTGGGTSAVPTTSPPTPDGTSVLMGE